MGIITLTVATHKPTHPTTKPNHQFENQFKAAAMVKFEVKPFAALNGTNKDDISTGLEARFDHNDLSLKVRADDSGLRGGNGGLRNGLVLSARKEGHFTFAYDMGRDAPALTFLSNARLGDRDVALKYTHELKGKNNHLQGRVEIDDKNTATIGWNLHGFDAPDYRQLNVRWNYRHDDKWSFEPSYDFGREAFAARSTTTWTTTTTSPQDTMPTPIPEAWSGPTPPLEVQELSESAPPPPWPMMA